MDVEEESVSLATLTVLNDWSMPRGGRWLLGWDSDTTCDNDDLEVPSFATASPRTPSLASNLPQELLLHIFSFIEGSSTLASACLVSHSWSPPATTTLYQSVHVPEYRHLKHFIHTIRRKGASTTGGGWDSSSGRRSLWPVRSGGGNTSSGEGGLWGVRSGGSSSSSGEGGLWGGVRGGDVHVRLRSKALELLKPSLEIAAGAGRRVLTVGSGTLTPIRSNRTSMESTSDLPNLIATKLEITPPVREKGLGSMVKRLSVSTSESKVVLLRNIHHLLPNLKSLHIKHQNLADPGPPLPPTILTSLEPFIPTLTSLTIEDVDAPCWPDLCRILREHGSNLRHLNIEAVTDIDAFESTSDLSDVFPGMKGLGFVRLDGLPVGPDSSVGRLVAGCRFLRAVTLDYCLDVTVGFLLHFLFMDVMTILWNHCEHLEFLGLAGVVGPMTTDVKFEYRPTLKTVRLVDCDVFNELFEEISLRAPSISLLRMVFEDDGCDGI
ncbi:hypothetical protein HK097_004962, partial [Rhizophlyctis rosea]